MRAGSSRHAIILVISRAVRDMCFRELREDLARSVATVEAGVSAASRQYLRQEQPHYYRKPKYGRANHVQQSSPLLFGMTSVPTLTTLVCPPGRALVTLALLSLLSSQVSSLKSRQKLITGQPGVGFPVPLIGLFHYVRRQLRRRRLVVPSGAVEPVSHKLLVVVGLRLAWLVR